MLVVDDEWAIAAVLADLLTDEGYGVLSASNGRDALAMLEAHPDVVLVVLDYMMPIMDGVATLAAIRARPQFADLPVIMMTSLPQSSLQVDPDSYDAFLRKPFLIDDILRAIELVFARRRPRS
ncbi:response regulator [uncultured Alsobacter sp.]|uniref:response regulator n=1 Tax=uncultured Alsobacter sp. TaxID=1748258 RepID=UPI0025FE1F36|nr:response regulator [uncultured Alsobacter sp.]